MKFRKIVEKHLKENNESSEKNTSEWRQDEYFLAGVENSKKEFDNSNWMVIIPRDASEAMRLGDGTPWDISAEGSDNYFSYYKGRGDTPYIILNKHDLNERYLYMPTVLKAIEDKDGKNATPDTFRKFRKDKELSSFLFNVAIKKEDYLDAPLFLGYLSPEHEKLIQDEYSSSIADMVKSYLY